MASEINGVAALARLRSRSCIIDGEAVACGDDGIACFELIRRWDSDQSVFMWAFDLIELDGVDMRREPLIQRKALLERALARAQPGLCFNEHLDEEDGPLVFQHACKLGQRGSCRSVAIPRILPAARATGSKVRIRTRRP
jgi:bifunctional non-homologous end joining protein LigD